MEYKDVFYEKFKNHEGKIIINGSSHHRVIPVLAFSEKNAQLLLDVVDKLERINNNVKSIIRK